MKIFKAIPKPVRGGLLVVAVGLMLTSCAALNTYLKQLKGDLLGEDYRITEYDNFGNPTLRVHGDKVNMQAELDACLLYT